METPKFIRAGRDIAQDRIGYKADGAFYHDECARVVYGKRIEHLEADEDFQPDNSGGLIRSFRRHEVTTERCPVCGADFPSVYNILKAEGNLL